MVYSIIQKSQIEDVNRLDAEYYQPEYFIDFTKGSWRPVGDFVAVCQYGISQAMNDKRIGYPIFKMDDIQNAFLFNDNVRYADINEDIFNSFKLKKNDVLFNRVNSEEFVGRTGIFKLDTKAVFASYLIKLRVTPQILPDYLNMFLNSSFGIKQIKKFRRRAVNQANVNAEELKQIKIAVLPLDSQKKIQLLCDESWNSFEQSKILYSQAEVLLLEELGLRDFKPDEDLSYVVNLNDVKSAHRMDAEYFQPKYNKLLEKLRLKKAKPLVVFISTYSTGFPFESYNYKNEGIPLIRINNIRKGYLDLSDVAYLAEEDYLLAPQDITKPGDIVLSMSGTIGATAIIPDDIPKSSINQRILRFTPKGIDKYYLTLVLNTIIGEYQLARIGTGGVQTNISYKDIKEILIPPIEDIQQKIADLVHRSHEARTKAKELLEEAKQKVEKMILTECDNR